MKKIKTYNISKNTTFDLSQLNKDLPDGIYTIKTQAVSVNGKKSPESAGITYKVDSLNPLGLPPFTIRCKFSTAGQPFPAYTGVTWDSVNQVDSDGYIWDITKNSTDWTNLLRSETTLVEVLGANLTGVTKLDRAFGEDEQLVSVALFDTSTVTSFRNTFRSCTSLLNVPRFNTSAGTDFTQMFIYCSNLKSVPNIDLTSATTIKFLFGYCTSLEKAILSNSTTSLTVTECLFGECHSLKDIKFINMDTSKVTIMYHMFDTCSSLSSIPFFDTSSCYGFNYMFKNCTSLTEVPALDTSKATKVVGIFIDCINVRSGALSLYQQLSTQANPPSEYSDAFKNCGSETESGKADLKKIPRDWGGDATPIEPRNIWIDFKFLDPDFNPKDDQLALGTEESNGVNRAFKADWQLIDEDENIWRWGVTEGTDLSLAFRYGGGEQSFPLIVAENYKDIPEEMWRQEGYTSLAAIVSDCVNWWSDEIAKHHINFTGSAEVVDWDLTNATTLDNLFGDNPYWRCAIVGTLPDLYSEASRAVYMFGRLYDIISVGKITMPYINGDIQKMLFAMTSLQDIPEIELGGHPQELDRLFWQDCNVSKSSIEAAYNYLNTNFGTLGHTATFTQCGLYKDPTALDNIPASWGGKA